MKTYHTKDFSIIIPCYNSEEYVRECILSALGQECFNLTYEIIVIDDCSTDSTHDIVKPFISDKLIFLKTNSNSGPGAARNEGLNSAHGEWIIFLDSDDELRHDALEIIKSHITTHGHPNHDVIGFNWLRKNEVDNNSIYKGNRLDDNLITLNKRDLISRYLSLRMDGSVIFTAIRRNLISENKLQFADGYHEDVDFIFKVYLESKHISYINDTIYIKRNNPTSIVNDISCKHTIGFLRAWEAIAQHMRNSDKYTLEEYLIHYKIGLVGIVATRIRELVLQHKSVDDAIDILQSLYNSTLVKKNIIDGFDTFRKGTFETKYMLITRHFIETMGNEDLSERERARDIIEYTSNTLPKCWSCTDLHNSLFLGPDEIRTCCKRFFVDGKMKGDVVLLSLSNQETDSVVTAADIQAAKATLLNKINCGDSTDCDGCPYLEFKAWGSISPMDIRYLSMEHHSICNLRCTYCDETYYGGAKPKYDVEALANSLLESGSIKNCENIVWGGGEPVLGKEFTSLIKQLSQELPSATQRVLTNSLRFSDTVNHLISDGRLLITTSIDAGSETVFRNIRGKTGLAKILSNLRTYSSSAPECVTIKYIFTFGNDSLNEIHSFVENIRNYDLIKCNFQISVDFKNQFVPVESIFSICALYCLLIHQGCSVVFFDDLVRQRLVGMNESNVERIKDRLRLIGLSNEIADPSSYKEIIVWGAGWQSKHLLEKSAFFKKTKIRFFVDSTKDKIGGNFMGYDVAAPDALEEYDMPIFISAAQSYPLIYGKYKNLGFSDSRLIKGLVI